MDGISEMLAIQSFLNSNLSDGKQTYQDTNTNTNKKRKGNIETKKYNEKV